MQDLQPLIDSLQGFAQKRLNFERPPKLFLKQDEENAQNVLGKTAFYDPQEESVTLFISNRHPKDILRSLAHELVHHTQNLRGDLSPEKCGEMGMGYAQDNSHMREMEREAYEQGNMCFRDWEDGYKKKVQEIKNLKENKEMTVKISRKELKGLITKLLSERTIKEADKKDAMQKLDADKLTKELAAAKKKGEDAAVIAQLKKALDKQQAEQDKVTKSYTKGKAGETATAPIREAEGADTALKNLKAFAGEYAFDEKGNPIDFASQSYGGRYDKDKDPAPRPPGGSDQWVHLQNKYKKAMADEAAAEKMVQSHFNKLSFGDTSNEIVARKAKSQERNLRKAGFRNMKQLQKMVDAKETGTYDEQTMKAVKRFQKWLGFGEEGQDGIYGSATRRRLAQKKADEKYTAPGQSEPEQLVSPSTTVGVNQSLADAPIRTGTETRKMSIADLKRELEDEKLAQQKLAQQKRIQESRIQTPESEKALNESMFGKKNNEIFNRLKALWAK
jgi:hypothetical protein